MTADGRRAAIAAVFAASIATPAAALALTRSPADAVEVDALRQRSPAAAALLEQGEARAVAGDVASAEDLFKQGETTYPNASILWRRDCEMLTLLGRRDDALRACNSATESLRSRLNFGALLRALVTGPEPPRPMDLFVTLSLEENQRRRAASADPLLVATDCDMAESLGDGNMLQECADELRTTARNEPDTKRAMAMLAERCPPWRFWAGWGLLVAAGAATAVDALGRSRRRGRASAAVAAGLLAWSAAATLATEARAQTAESPPHTMPSGGLSKWPVDDDDPVRSIPSDKDKNADPLQFGYWIQDVIMKAEHATKRGNHAQAAKLWSALGVAVPDRAVAFTKACDEYEALGDHDKAIDACGQALLRDGLTIGDYEHFVNVVLLKPGPLAPKEIAALGQVLDHMKADETARPVANELECEVGVRTSNVKQLKECTAALSATAPDDPKTISYRWALAIQQDKFGEAARLVEQAKAKGVQGEGLASMERTTAEGAREYHKRLVLWLACLVLLFGATGLGARAVTRKRTPQPV